MEEGSENASNVSMKPRKAKVSFARELSEEPVQRLKQFDDEVDNAAYDTRLSVEIEKVDKELEEASCCPLLRKHQKKDDGAMQLQLQHLENSRTASVDDDHHSNRRINDFELSINQCNRKIFRCSVGVFFGSLAFPYCYFMLLKGFSRTPWNGQLEVSGCVSGVLILVLGVLCTRSHRLACTLCVSAPELSTNRGRAVFISIIVGFILSGPVDNMILNSNAVHDSYECVVSKMKNLSREALLRANEAVQERETMLNESISKKLMMRKILVDIRTKLLNANNGISCLVLNCPKLNRLLARSESLSIMNETAFSTKPANVTNSVEIYMAPAQDIKLLRKKMEEIAVLIKKSIHTITFVVTKVLYASVLILLYNAYRYVISYYTMDHFDNHLVHSNHYKMKFFNCNTVACQTSSTANSSTSNGSSRNHECVIEMGTLNRDTVDGSSERKKLESILPLKRWEKKYFQEYRACHCTIEEKMSCCFSLLPTVLMTCVTFGLFFGDYMLCQGVTTIERHAKFAVKINGSSDFAGIELSSERCLPKVSPFSGNSAVVCFSLLLLCVVTSSCQAYANRLRPVICNFFYPTRMEERQDWLYRHIANKRQQRPQTTTRLARTTRLQRLRMKEIEFFSRRGLPAQRRLSAAEEDDLCYLIPTHHCPGCQKLPPVHRRLWNWLVGRSDWNSDEKRYPFTFTDSDGTEEEKKYVVELCAKCYQDSKSAEQECGKCKKCDDCLRTHRSAVRMFSLHAINKNR